ncbi:MAG: hypothetical protein KF834_05825 [Burkholderiales bacterium]|nr:hypothetical protein [Burkholderiales bacterium]
MKTPAPETPEQRVLRTSREPCLHVGDAEVHEALTRDPAGCFRHMLQALRDVAGGRLALELPPKQLFSDPGADSDFRIMPCVVRGNSRVTKTVKLVGTNIAQRTVPDQITVGKALVIDPEENFVTHIVDACLLSSARTGLCAAVAMHLLAPRRGRLTVIGSGRVGYYAALYAAGACGIRDIVFADREPARAAAAAAALSTRMPDCASRAGAMDALPDTDIVVLATTSDRALCAPPGWHAGLVISLGADIDHQSELDPAWAQTADIFVDTADSARFGDLRHWIARGLLAEKDLTDFGTLLRAGTAAENGRPRLFVSTGSALFDNLALDYLLRQIR